MSLRLARSGVERVAPDAPFSFAGEPLVGIAGESIAAALAAAGRPTLGQRRDGAGRGIFCGMGVCQECIVTIDGMPGRRACMTALAAGMRIEPQGYLVDLDTPSAAAPARTAPVLHQPEILVVGGGAAGLAAARAARLCGAEVLLIDERPALGGQYFKQLAKTHRFAAPAAEDAQFRRGRALIDEVERLGAMVWRDAVLWGAFAPLELAIEHDATRHVVRPRRLILATGAYERGVPFPGWTLPGCMTTGAAQTLQRAYRVAPGRRVLVAGNGPLNFQVAADLVAAGIEVVALIEAAGRPGAADLAPLLRATLASPDLMRDGLRYVARLRRAGVPILHESAIIRAEGTDRVEHAVAARIGADGNAVPGTEQRFAVDVVCSGYGFLPSSEIARALGCAHRLDPARGALAIDSDADGATSVAGVHVVGDGGGMGGARAAVEQGFIAGAAAARSLGHEVGAAVVAELAQRRRQLGRHRAFQAALWQLFRAPVLTHQLATPDTVLCRCEGVTRATIEQAMADGAESLAGVKRHTRAGMGRCQGRYCSAIIAGFAAAGAAGELDFQAPRPPIKPMPIGALAEPPEP